MADKETKDDLRGDMDLGEKDEEVYSEVGREKLQEDDEISPTEEGFMEGAEDKGELGTCGSCGKPISQDSEEVVETKVDGEIVWYCNEECAEKGRNKK